MQEMIPFVGPHTDIMGPDMGTNEQVMAWFMDTYSVYQGYAVNEIVTGKPVDRRHRRPARSDRTRRRLSDRARDGHAEDGSGKMHRDHPGIRQRRFGRGFVARLKSGVKVVGISDRTVAIYNPKGIDVKAAEQHMIKKGNLRAFDSRRSCRS
jgi:glutamate dehydrogenase (NAD(P)+)